MEQRQQLTNNEPRHDASVSTPSARMRALARELVNDDGWSQQKVATLLDRSQGWVSQLLAGTIASVEADTIDRAVHGLGLDANFFTKRSLGANESYKAHRRTSADEETRLVVDELPGLEEYERGAGRLADDERRHVLGLASNDGPDVFDEAQVHIEVEAYRRRKRRREQGLKLGATGRPRDPENVVEQKPPASKGQGKKGKGKR